MPFVQAAGVQVNFPFEPYACQHSYMDKVVTCLKSGVNGILESPTGTGKTLCLLCSSLAWLEDKKAQVASQRWKLAQTEPGTSALDVYKAQLANQLDSAAGEWGGELAPPKIIYASRTHSQLSQVVKELKRTAYGHVRSCILGSRDQLCIHPHVMKEESNTAKVHMCRAKVTARTCHFYNNVEAAKGNFANNVMDIEDLVTAGKKHNCCPYYVARELKAEADIIFMPYNYLLDPKSRRAHGVELNGNIIIFYEAHNLEKICEDSTSFDLTSADLAGAIRELHELSEKLCELVKAEEQGAGVDSETLGSQDFNLKEVFELKALLHNLEEEIDRMHLAKPEEGVTLPGKFIFELFQKVKLTFESKTMVAELIDKIVTHLTGEATSMFHSRGTGLSKFGDVLKIVYSRDLELMGSVSSLQTNLSKHYKVHICQEKPAFGKKKQSTWDSVTTKKSTRTLSYWCFSPQHAMEELRAHGVKSIILTSGTLSPLSSFTSEMGISFPIQLENPHVIDPDQVFIGVVGKGPDGTLLNSSYQHRFNPAYQVAMGNAVVNFARIVPHGLLLFFPSYPVMEKCLENWQENNIWNRIEQYKPIVVEPRSKQEFLCAMDSFYDRINDANANGATFAAVCRGKVSEGLDFSDNNGRAVVITGLPYPPRMDPKVMLKMQFLDEAKCGGGKGLSGNEWYQQQASRAVNQAVGRVIRHRQDYGAVLLCDNRFGAHNAKSQLPSWIRPSVKVYDKFGLAVKDLMMFFKNIQKKMPEPVPKTRKAPTEPGCQGAYFEPTLSRQVHKDAMANLDRASTVATHVPSRKARDNLSMAKLTMQYKSSGDSYNIVTGPKEKGLLGALACTEKTVEKQNKLCQTNQLNSLESVPSFQDYKQLQDANKPKKKIVIKKRSETVSISDAKLQSAEAYIAEVKNLLCMEGYRRFSQTLAQYKKNEDIDVIVACLADLFTDTPEKYPLFRKFYRFVRPQHKAQFDEICKNLTGIGCGSKQEDAVAKKRVTNRQIGQEKAEKKCRVDPDSVKLDAASGPVKPSQSVTKPTVDPVDNQLPKTSAFNSGLDVLNSQNDKLSKSEATSDSMQNKCKAVECTTASDIMQPKTIISDSRTSSQHPKAASNGTLSECPQNGASYSVNVLTESNRTDSRAENSAQTYMDRMTYLHHPMSGHTCCKCKEDARVPLKAHCGHICCMECWKECIRDLKACPECGNKVKRKHLARLFFVPGSGSNR